MEMNAQHVVVVGLARSGLAVARFLRGRGARVRLAARAREGGILTRGEETDLPQTERFEIVRHLGSGGMGIVYEALDRESQERMALKTLRHVDAQSL